MTARTTRRAGLLRSLLLLSACLASLGAHGGDKVPSSDRAQAAELAEAAQFVANAGDLREATHLLLSAVRWDPSRLDDHRQAIVWLEGFAPAAAVRQAGLLLDKDPEFGLDNPALLKRLRGVARSMASAEADGIAAKLARRSIQALGLRPQRSKRQIAYLWKQAGESYGSSGRTVEASQAFDRMQRAMVDSESERATILWDVIADYHLAAQHADPAAVAIGWLADRDGETAQVIALRGRLALLLGEPLAAAEHALEAIAAVQGGDASIDPPPYRLYAEAMRTINQSSRAAERLAAQAAERPGDDALRLAMIDALAWSGDVERAWLESGLLNQELLSRVPLIEDFFDWTPATDDSERPRESLYEAASQRILLAIQLARVPTALSESLLVSNRLGDRFSIFPALEGAKENAGFLSQANLWLDQQSPGARPTVASESQPPADRTSTSGDEPLIGFDHTRSHIAYLLGRYDEVARYSEAMLAEALEAGVSRGVVAQESRYRLDELHAAGAHEEACRLGRRMLDHLAPTEGVRDPSAQPDMAQLRATLARMIGIQGNVAGRTNPRDYDEAARQLATARGEAPKDAYVAYRSIFNALYCGRYDEAIAAGERAFAPAPNAILREDDHPELYRDGRVFYAASLMMRGEPGDDQLAGEILEPLLDSWPNDPNVLAYLAWHDSQSDASSERAVRLARQALEASPQAADMAGFLGLAQLKANRPEQAIVALRKALELAEEARLSLGELALFRDAYAEAFRETGRAEEAEAVEAR